ncbi:MAG: hypothetical protein P8N09_10625 [Planctomycetota bacterium]|jgi:hypothetical protein|nr:hypothetical protein [Planctomycetota bacterium]
MKWLTAGLITLFFCAVATFVTVGLTANERARTESTDLLRRIETTREAWINIPPVSYSETEALAAEWIRLEELGNQRLSMLTDRRYAPIAENLEAVLDRMDLATLQPGTPLRNQLVSWAADDPRTEATLSSLFSLVHLGGLEEVESLDRRKQAHLKIPDLTQETFELVVVSEMEGILDFLEQLAPGRGEPILSVTGASLRRIDETLWSTTPESLSSPPVRLWVRLEAHQLESAANASSEQGL